MKHDPTSPVLLTIFITELMGFLRDEREVADRRVGGLANHPPRTTSEETSRKRSRLAASE
jgi:hypothetical protein